MADFIRNTRHIRAFLASLLLCGSFAWGQPAETPAAEGEGEAEPAPGDPWAGVKISDAYDYAKCPSWGEKNQIGAAACSRCGNELLQPTADMDYPPWVFVPGKGYYREGTLLEPGERNMVMLIAGLVLAGSGITTIIVAGISARQSDWEPYPEMIASIAGLGLAATGAVLLIVARATPTEAVYAFASGERFEPYERPAFALRSPDSEGATLKVEVTLLGF